MNAGADPRAPVTPPADPGAQSAARPPAQGFVELRAVSKSYREGGAERAVLRGFSATIARGETIALYGRSGSGKSTLLNLLAGVDAPDAGDVLIDGVAIHRLDEDARTRFRRRRIGSVFQTFNLIPTLTVRENVLLRLDLDRRADAAARAHADALLGRVGLAARGNSFPDRLSGGEQQRVAVVAALAHRPDLVLADEPTGSLDRANAEAVLALLRDLARDAGATLLIATHGQEVAAIADRVWTMVDGSLADGSLAAGSLSAGSLADGRVAE
jgi:putative ABC transport system ATP-binding protein